MNPLAELAVMNPDCPVVRSLIRAVNPALGSVIASLITSPELISRVCAFGVSVATSASCGLGGPAGLPLRCRKAKLTGSSQAVLRPLNPNAASRLSMVIAAHHFVELQLMLSSNGVMPGG